MAWITGVLSFILTLQAVINVGLALRLRHWVKRAIVAERLAENWKIRWGGEHDWPVNQQTPEDH